jgi:hypothetical protein
MTAVSFKEIPPVRLTSSRYIVIKRGAVKPIFTLEVVDNPLGVVVKLLFLMRIRGSSMLGRESYTYNAGVVSVRGWARGPMQRVAASRDGREIASGASCRMAVIRAAYIPPILAKGREGWMGHPSC